MIPSFDIDADLFYIDGELTKQSQVYVDAAQDMDSVLSSLARMLNNSVNLQRQNDKEMNKEDGEIEEQFNRANMIHPSMFDVVNRCRKNKISFHIRLPGYVIERLKLNLMVYNLTTRGDKFVPNAEEGKFNGN